MKYNSKVNSELLENYLKNGDKENIIKFYKDRISERFIKPLKNVKRVEDKSGFTIMSNSVIIIETFIKLIKGEETTKWKYSGKIFNVFFNEQIRFKDFKNLGFEFYHDVRCGLLHNGQTNGLWKLNRFRDTPIFENYNINANKFLEALILSFEETLDSYIELDYNKDQIWKNIKFSTNQLLKNHLKLYFAYGSNMDFQRINSKDRLNGNAKIIGKGVLKDHELIFNKISSKFENSGFANICYKKNSYVEGIIYEITGDIEIVKNSLNKLDKVEGYSPTSENNHYTRITKKIELYPLIGNNEISNKIEAEVFPFIYICENENFINNNLKPKKEYLNHLLKGEKYLSQEYFNKLKNFSTFNEFENT